MANIKLFELKKLQSEFPKQKITSSKDAYEFIKQFYGDDMEVFESAFILLLDRVNNTIGYAKISQGGISATVIDVRLIAKYAVESLASSVIMAHNHPSGNMNPSRQDHSITQKVNAGLNVLEINLYDHLILTADGFYSFANEGDL